LPQIARALHTTVEYLAGHTDDPNRASVVVDAVSPTHVLLPVELPTVPVLARMFEGLLRAMPAEADLSEQATLLAKWLPIGLSQLRDLLPVSSQQMAPAEPAVEKELAEALATPDRLPT
jgi:hypothetical protein